jgi:hypothetical protein
MSIFSVVLLLILVVLVVYIIYHYYSMKNSPKYGNGKYDNKMGKKMMNNWDDGVDMVQDAISNAVDEVQSWYNNRKSTGRRSGATDVNRNIASVNKSIENLDTSNMTDEQKATLQALLQKGNDFISSLNKNGSGDRVSRFQNPFSAEDDAAQYQCADFSLRDGAYCIQDTPNGPKCFLSGNDETGGWYMAADMENCAGRPNCGDVMIKCQGYDATDVSQRRPYSRGQY